MERKEYSEEVVDVFEKALRDSFSSLTSMHNEHFYYFAFIMDEGLHPYISAWSYESLEESIINNKISDEEKGWWKWDYADSPYAVYGYDEFFGEAGTLLDKREKELTEDELYDKEWYVRIASMIEAMKRLDNKGFFGTGEDREKVVINVEIAPPDGIEKENALFLNPKSDLLDDYLQYCEESEEI